MKLPEFDPKNILGNNITKFDRQELCSFTARLCEYIKADVGAGVYRGGIYPENISLDEEGRIAVGKASEDEWSGQELDFLPPELYWNGRRTPASDVYSIGLLLYYAVTGGRLPFEGKCRDPQLRRMSGDAFDIPPEAGRRLGEIIEKSTRFKASERYQSMEEMRVMAESCLKNLYLNGRSNAETLFRKSDDDLTDIEKLMVGIIEKEEDTPIPVPPETFFEEPEEPLPVEEPETVEAQKEPEIYIPEFFYKEDPGLEPVTVKRKRETPAMQYEKETETDRRTTEEIKRRKRRPVAVILLLCAVLVIASILFNAVMKDISEETRVTLQAAEELQQRQGTSSYDEDDEPAASAVNPTEPVVDDENVLDIPPEPSEAPYIPGQEAPEQVESAVPMEHGYQLIIKDVSWTDAKAECEAMGGHLVVVNDAEEFAEIASLADQYGIQKIWIGGHRENNAMLWEDGSTEVYTPWSKGEPSYYDSGDNVPENYVMMWFNRGWAFNDSRNDPCHDYPNMYSGKICYICEFGD